jgi:transcriptional regulator with XRE-family HTH domain
MIAARVALARAVRRRREAARLSQAQLAELIRSSQARGSKIEAAARGVSLDLMARSLFAAGGSLNDLARAFTPKRPPRRKPVADFKT